MTWTPPLLVIKLSASECSDTPTEPTTYPTGTSSRTCKLVFRRVGDGKRKRIEMKWNIKLIFLSSDFFVFLYAQHRISLAVVCRLLLVSRCGPPAVPFAFADRSTYISPPRRMFDDFFMKSFYNLNLIITSEWGEMEMERRRKKVNKNGNWTESRKKASKTLKVVTETQNEKKGKREQTMSFHHHSHNNR